MALPLTLFATAGTALVSLSAFATPRLFRQTAPATPDVLTWHNNNYRTGVNNQETILTPATVASTRFAHLADYPVDGQLYAQPLFKRNVAVKGVSRNVVFVATEHNSVYAFDADHPGTSGVLWHTDFNRSGISNGLSYSVSPVPVADLPGKCGVISPEVGITSTPVIDPATDTIYVVTKTKEVYPAFAGYYRTSYIQRLHALDIHTGAEKFGGPVEISGSVAGTGEGSVGGRLFFDPLTHLQRAALTLMNGNVYIAWASHCDQPCYHGFVMGYNAQTLKQTSIYSTTPDGNWGGIWQAGAGLVGDGSSLYCEVGNSSPNRPGRPELGDSFVKLSTQGGGLALADYFKPFNWLDLDATDNDVGSGGAIYIPAPYQWLVGGGKEGRVYFLNPNNLGGLNTGFDNVLLSLPGGAGGVNTDSLVGTGDNIVNTPAYFNDNLYYIGVGDTLKSYWLPGISSSNLDFNRGIPNGAVRCNGNAQTSGSRLHVTGGANQQGSAWSQRQLSARRFATEFTLQASSAHDNGLCFVLQNVGVQATGGKGSGLGYAGIAHSVAVKFDLFNSAASGGASGLYVDGQTPVGTQTPLAPVSLNSGHPIHVKIKYDGAILAVTVTDAVTRQTNEKSYPVDIAAHVGGDTAYAGFTSATVAANSAWDVVNWSYAAPNAYSDASKFGWPGATPSISANGTSSAIVWAIEAANMGNNVFHARLRAFPADTRSAAAAPLALKELFRGDAGDYVKFTVPTVANGKVFVGTQDHLAVFGLR